MGRRRAKKRRDKAERWIVALGGGAETVLAELLDDYEIKVGFSHDGVIYIKPQDVELALQAIVDFNGPYLDPETLEAGKKFLPKESPLCNLQMSLSSACQAYQKNASGKNEN